MPTKFSGEFSHRTVKRRSDRCGSEAPVDETFVEVESAADVLVFRERFQCAAHHARTNPLLESTMARLVRRTLG